MAFKLVSGTQKALQPQQQAQQPNILQRLGGGVGELARPYQAMTARAIEGLIGAPQDIYSGLVGGIANPALGAIGAPQLPGRLPFLPSSQDVKQGITQRFVEPNLPQGYLEPKGFAERIAQGVAGDPTIPIAAAVTGGASLPVAIGRSTAQQAGMQTAESAGLGPVGQFIAGTLGGLGFDAKRLGKTPQGIVKAAKNEYEKSYAKRNQLAPKINAPAPKTSQVVNQLVEELEGRGSDVDTRNMRKVLKNLQSQINEKDNVVNVKNLLEREKEIGEKVSQHPFYKAAYKSIQEDLQDVAKTHPEFGKQYNRAKDLYKAVNLRSEIGEMIENNTGLKNLFKNKTTNGIIGALLYNYGGGLPGVALGGASTYGAKYSARIADFLRTPEARKLASQAFKEVAADNTQGFGNTVKALKQEYDTYDQSTGKKKPRFRQIA
jgi:hypothetical protein